MELEPGLLTTIEYFRSLTQKPTTLVLPDTRDASQEAVVA
jgi:hypothetical protein